MVSQNELQTKQKDLEVEANNLISKGGKVCIFSLSFFFFLHSIFFSVVICTFQVFASILPYNEASDLCGGCLPDYIPQVRICLLVFFLLIFLFNLPCSKMSNSFDTLHYWLGISYIIFPGGKS